MTLATFVFGTLAVNPTVVPPSTFDPAKKGPDITLSGGNLTAVVSSSATFESVIGTLSRSTSGKYYFEISIVAGSTLTVGVVDTTSESWGNYQAGDDTHSWGYYGSSGQKRHSASGSAFGATYTTGAVIGVAVDFGSGSIWFAKNNSWQASGDPAGGTNPAFTGLAATLFPIISTGTVGDTVTAAFSSGNTYSPPSGFSLWG